MAVHVLAVLAYKEGDPVTSAMLAASVNTNPVIIRRLLLSLQRARLVDTRKGAGGSRLSRSPGRINLAEVYRAVEAIEPFASPTRKANTACPVGHCIRETLNKVFASAENAMERDLEKTTLAGVIGMIKAACPCAAKKTV